MTRRRLDGSWWQVDHLSLSAIVKSATGISDKYLPHVTVPNAEELIGMAFSVNPLQDIPHRIVASNQTSDSKTSPFLIIKLSRSRPFVHTDFMKLGNEVWLVD